MEQNHPNYTSVVDYEAFTLPELKARLTSEFEHAFDQMVASHQNERMFLSFVTMQFESMLRRAGTQASVQARLDVAVASDSVLEHWARMPTWGQNETAALLNGLDPALVKEVEADIYSVVAVNDMAKKFADVVAILRRGGQHTLTPTEALGWADQFSVNVPPNLRSAIERMWVKKDNGAAQGGDKKPRGDREENLLRVIAGLWEFSGLPPRPNTAADRLSALFAGWGWEKPTKGAIADTILTPASKINRIQK